MKSHSATTSTASGRGCIAGMFRRLLCSNSLPTHPTDHSSEELQRSKNEDGKNIESLSRTGVVARLMGLDLMPGMELNQKSISRSQSMSSLRELKPLKEKRNLKACSFREIPTYFELQDENFFILSFDYGGKNAEFGSKQRRSEQRKQRKTEDLCRRRESVYQKNKENQDINKIPDDGKNLGNLRDSTNIIRSRVGKDVGKKRGDAYKQERFKKKKKNKENRDSCSNVKKTKADCDDSEYSSPNSVLDFVEFPLIQEIPSSEKFSKLANSKSRRTLSEELENHKNLKQESDEFQHKSCEKVESKKSWCRDENYVKLWGQICKFADLEAIQHNWQQKATLKHDVCQEISVDFELEILDDLVGELVNQLNFDSLCL